MAYTEFSFSVDDFKNPKIFKDPEAIATLLTRLLLLEPGAIQSHPEMGVGIISRFRYGVEGVSKELASEFRRQIIKYLPQFQGVKIEAREEAQVLIVTCEIDDVLYAIYYDTEKSTVNSDYIPITSL